MTKNNDGRKHRRFGRIYEKEQEIFYARRKNTLGPRFSSQFLIDKFSSRLYLLFPRSPSRGPGMASDYFALERSERQGNPLSPYLFILAVENLAISNGQNVDIKGIKIGNHEAKLLQYAHDTTAMLSDENSAKTLFEELEEFKNFSGR